MELGQHFWPLTRPNPVAFNPVTRPDPTRSLSVVKQILDNGLIAVSVTCQKPKPLSDLIYSISRLSEFMLLQQTAWNYADISLQRSCYSVETRPRYTHMLKLKTWSNSGSDTLTHDPTRPDPAKIDDPVTRDLETGFHLWCVSLHVECGSSSETFGIPARTGFKSCW